MQTEALNEYIETKLQGHGFALPFGKWSGIVECVRALGDEIFFLSLTSGVTLALLNDFLSCSFCASWQ